MNKKKILGIVVSILGLVIIIISIKFYAVSDKQLIKQLFEISETDYEIVEVKNELNYFLYTGCYDVTVRVKEEDMESFIKEVEKLCMLPEEGADYSIVFKNISGREMKRDDVIYVGGGGVRRKIINPLAPKPKGIGIYILHSNVSDGAYEIQMSYNE